MVHGKIDTEGLEFEPLLEDVETLNRWAKKGKLEMTKLSYHALARLTDKYALLRSGSALGRGCGPLLISKNPVSKEAVGQMKRIAIPGELTTANLLLGLAFPTLNAIREPMLFSKIENAVLEGSVDAGLIIHENRFTYQQKGLHKVIDLGAWWEKTTGCAIPLGGIVVRKDLPKETREKINRVLRRSVRFAFDHPDSSTEYVRQHSQEMEEAVVKQHIELYVNHFSEDLGAEGIQAVETLFQKALASGVIGRYEDVWG